MAVAQLSIETVAAMPMAAVAGRSDFAGLPKAITEGLDKVYAVLKGSDVGPLGANTVYYAPGIPIMSLLIGVRLDRPFPGPQGEVVAAETPAGEVVHAVYFGDYAKMKPAHEAAHEEAARLGRGITGASWEVYGDWSDDPAKLRTDIYYLLKPHADG